MINHILSDPWMVLAAVVNYILSDPWMVLAAWLSIGYLHTYILRFALGVPCRFGGDSLESTFFVRFLLWGPVGLIVIPVLIVDYVRQYLQVVRPMRREAKRAMREKVRKQQEEDRRSQPFPLYL